MAEYDHRIARHRNRNTERGLGIRAVIAERAHRLYKAPHGISRRAAARMRVDNRERTAVVHRFVAVVLAAGMLACACGSSQRSTSTSSPAPTSGKITVRSTEALKPHDITDGGIAGAGQFTIAGAINDKGKVRDYRTVNGNTAVIRRVAVGKHGAITFLITINLATHAPERWRIASATRAYQGLRGDGLETVDDYNDTPATFMLTGTVSS
jgi:hypothetical protein